MTLSEKALALATEAHGTQVRKAGGAPYIVHPVAVADMLRQWGFSEEVVAAAYVHDVLEDTPVREEKLRAELGDEVTNLVKAVSEDKSLPWEERKKVYIEHVRRGSEAVKAISIADKIHNLQSLIDVHERMGTAVWAVFNRGKEKKLWFEEEMLRMFKETWHHPLVEQYEHLVEKMRALD